MGAKESARLVEDATKGEVVIKVFGGGQLGAQAVPMSRGEVYTSTQTGVIDGQENPFAIIHAFKLSAV